MQMPHALAVDITTSTLDLPEAQLQKRGQEYKWSHPAKRSSVINHQVTFQSE